MYGGPSDELATSWAEHNGHADGLADELAAEQQPKPELRIEGHTYRLADELADDEDSAEYRRGVADTLKRLNDTMDSLAMQGFNDSARWVMMRQVMRTAAGR